MYKVDKAKKILIIKRNSVVTKHIRFDGKIVAGMFSSFWGNIEAEDVYLAKGCLVRGDIICNRAVIGAYTVFKRIVADDGVLVQNKCIGHEIKAKNVKITRGAVINIVQAEDVIIVDSISKLRRVNARKIIAIESKI
ncbi:MAG TPA: hypothetical protein EYG81_02490 [Archaeoglobus profundus]|nr:hypothetical protein [Archaeoglobus profundus]